MYAEVPHTHAELLVLMAGLGLVIGSFLCTVALRLPMGLPIVFGRSRCDGCGHVLKPWQLIPLWGWVCQRGRCQFCRNPISKVYLVGELSAATVCLWSFVVVPAGLLVPTIVLGWILLTLAIMDWRYLLLCNAVTLPLLVAGLAMTWVFWPQQISEHVIGTICGATFLYGVNVAYRFARHRNGLGFGDVKLAAAAGAWLGWKALPSVYAIASGAALFVLLIRHALGAKVDLSMKVAFGSYLCLGTWLVWLYGPIVWS